MKKALTHKIKAVVILVLLHVMPVIYALPTETEYEGIVARTGYVDDGNWGAFPIGFSFDFFERTYTEFYVTSNGLVMFGRGSNQYTNNPIPRSTGADNYIAPFWDDLVIHETGDIMYQTIGTAPNRKLVVQFNNMSFWNSPVLLGTFQVIIYEGSNNIRTQYRSIVDLTSDRASGNSATIGLENRTGSAGVVCSYNTADYIHSEKAILFTPGGGTYTYDDNAVYEGIFLQGTEPRASTPKLISPAYNSTVSDTLTFQWEAATNAFSYFVVISQNSDLSSPIHTSADLPELSYDYILSPDQTYYWSAYSKNVVSTVSWSEIWKFQTSSTPPLVAVPQTMYLEQGEMRTATLLFTGGDAGSKTATITSLPAEGELYQYNAGIPGPRISSVPTVVSDGSFKVIYNANGATGNGVGNFDFQFSDATWTSTDETYTINVSPPGIPNFLYASKETDRVEITFDRDMADPTGKHLEFSVQDNGVDVGSVSSMLKSGDPATIIVYVSPDLNTDNSIAVAYTKGTVTAESGGVLESFDFQLAGKFAQVINFNVLPDKTYGDADYTLSATSSSGLPVTFSSSNTTVVSVLGSTATINGAGEGLIYASQTGDASYAAVTFERHQLVNKAEAGITLSNLSQEYTGSGIQVSAETVPADLNLKITYDGSESLPVDIGSYAVSVKVEEANYYGDDTDVLIISDLTPPVPDLPVLPDLTDECSLTPSAPTATDFYSGAITGTTTTPFPITAQGTSVISWSYDDGNGNISTQDQSVIIDDITPPVTPTLADVNGECTATVIAPTTTDACMGTITGTTSDPLTYTTQGSHLITWNFDDGNGNSIDVDQNVIILDITPPETPVLADVSGECSATVVAPTTTDVCEGNITGTTGDPLNYSDQGIYVITWNFDDGNGNSIDVDQLVEVLDITPPETLVLPDITGECSATAVAPTTTDACAGTITGTTGDPLSYSSQGSYVITWNFDDGNGNSTDVTQNVIVADITVPDIPVLTDVTGECSATATTPTTTDACAGTITGTTGDPLTYSTQGTHVITWNFDDGNGNSLDVSQNVIITDITVPETPVLEDVTGECSVTVTTPSTTDICAGTITGTTSDPLTYSTQGIHVITWTFDDGNGNSIDVSQNVILTDITPPEAPVLEDLTNECSITVVAPETTDVCAGPITGTTSDPLTYSTQGSHVITWTFDDGNGNSIEASQNVIITDLTAPTASCPDDVVTCDGRVSSIGLGDATDNCADPGITYLLSGATTGSGSGDASAEIFAPGETTVSYTLDDGNGNTSSCEFTVTHQVVDEIVVNLADGAITAENSGSFQWISCADNSVIEGETGSSFNPGVNGEYALILTQGACSATSECYLVDYTGLLSNEVDGVKVYPNPADQFISIKLDRENTNVTIKVINTSGQAVLVETLDRLSLTRLDISKFKSGMYLIQIHSDQMDRIVRVMKD